MSKGWKIFFKILYYVIAFSVGLFLVVVYPSAKKDELSFVYINNYVENKEFEKAVDLLSYVYNKEEIYTNKVATDSGIVIFETLSLYEKELEDKTKTVEINESYLCLIYDLTKLQFYGNENKTVIKVNDTEIKILSHDYNGDGVVDSVPSLINSTYICFNIDKLAYSNVDTIELIDKDGNSVFKLEELELEYNSDFFTAAQTFITKYNEAYTDGAFSDEENNLLLSEYDKIHKLNNNYQMIDTYKTSEKVFDEAMKDSVWFILIFFIWVFILGDCLVGKRHIFKFIKFIFFKIKNKIKPSVSKKDEAVSNNFFGLVTFKADICEGFDKDVIIAYECLDNKQCNFKVIINKTNDFIVKQRVHGGKYRLSKIECPDYEVLNLPEEIEVKGYTMLIKFNITNKK